MTVCSSCKSNSFIKYIKRIDLIKFKFEYSSTVHGLNGPCPVHALYNGDVGQNGDVDAFYASLNPYVRYFYEDDESGWGFSPFRQFR